MKFESVSLRFEPRDLWMGVYVKTPRGGMFLYLFICIVPTLPVTLKFRVRDRKKPRRRVKNLPVQSEAATAEMPAAFRKSVEATDAAGRSLFGDRDG